MVPGNWSGQRKAWKETCQRNPEFRGDRRPANLRMPSNIFFIHYTDNSELRKRLQRQEDELKFKDGLEYVENQAKI